MILQDDFSNTNDMINGPKAFFANMPLSKTLTMNLDVPEPWLVEPVLAMYAFSLFNLFFTEYIPYCYLFSVCTKCRSLDFHVYNISLSVMFSLTFSSLNLVLNFQP